VRPAGNIGIMFLNEVALGKEHHITYDDSSLTAAPLGHDCVIAKGRVEPSRLTDLFLRLYLLYFFLCNVQVHLKL